MKLIKIKNVILMSKILKLVEEREELENKPVNLKAGRHKKKANPINRSRNCLISMMTTRKTTRRYIMISSMNCLGGEEDIMDN